MTSSYYTLDDTRCVSLVLPGLLASEAVGPVQAETPFLCRCLSHSTELRCQSGTFESVVLKWFNGQAGTGENCAAVLGYQLDGLDVHDDEMVLRADPVFQQMDINNAVLADQSVLDLSAAEASAIIDTINLHFAADGLRFEAPGAMRWYAKFQSRLDISTRPLSHAVGRDVAQESPVGPDAAKWRRWLAEIEMLLYSHPVNQQRQSEGKAVVNSLWLWGEGDFPPADMQSVNDGCIFGDNFYTDSVAHQYGLESLRLDQFAANSASIPVLIVDDQLQVAAATGNQSLRIERLNHLEQFVFKPLWKNLGGKGWKSARVWIGGDRCLQINSGNRWQFWRRQKPFDEYIDATETVHDRT